MIKRAIISLDYHYKHMIFNHFKNSFP